ncbi:hypothetical protein ACSDR0_20760, partial [Streptosporangium sp. G11]|uniref:hypothetical protein n=1 Tax=Streptosporangium sp. G11 TaxID=3436926 RepID=UPI003EBC8398
VRPHSYKRFSSCSSSKRAATQDEKGSMVEAGPKVTPTMTVPSAIDWVGFDWYCQPISKIEETLATLESVTGSHQELFLLPQATPLRACGSKPGYQTDADLAELQWNYVDLAKRHPRVTGLMSFGLWVESTPVTNLPRTMDAHERIAAQALARSHKLKSWLRCLRPNVPAGCGIRPQGVKLPVKSSRP